MAEKAAIIQITNLTYNGTIYSIYIDAVVTDGSGGGQHVGCVATSANFNPVLPAWKSRIETALTAAAQNDYGLTVDQVIWPDFQVLGV